MRCNKIIRNIINNSKSTSSTNIVLPKWFTQQKGKIGTHEWRLYFSNSNNISEIERRSAWHELPLHPSLNDSSIITFICEIPKGTRAKMELLKEEPHNPIGQDIYSKKEGKPLRFFTYGDIPFNYGFSPQTWEDPSIIDKETKCTGDGDPIDIVQISKTPSIIGSIQAVRVLGVLGLIDEGETDWKIITELFQPGENNSFGTLKNVSKDLKDTIIKWFRDYKTTDGKKRNDLAFNGELRGLDEALYVLETCSQQYSGLINGTVRNPGYWLR